ncbi:MAG TPA: hypothetical protein VK824_07890 [Planctomycetota bacterium]|nr:hypothetical protein [Planctomycetota bacterium]
MNDPLRFPWKPAAVGAALLALALLTVTIRAGVIAEGHSLLQLEHRRGALHRRERDLQIQLQQRWQDIGRKDPASQPKGGSRS